MIARMPRAIRMLRNTIAALGEYDKQPPKKKPALRRAESIFLEEDRGDGLHYADMREINPICILDIDYMNLE
jgi:hypothetical protein